MTDKKFLKLIISRIDGPVFDGEVISVSVPGIAGDMQLLADHEPLISPLRPGTITVESARAGRETFEIEGGTLEISKNNVTVLI